MQTLVVGAGGPLGIEVVRNLRLLGLEVVATIRQDRGDTVSQLTKLGARVERSDLSQIDRFADLLNSVSRMVMIAPIIKSWAAISKLDNGHLKRVVFFSSNNATVDLNSAIYAQIRDAEREIQQSGLSWTILRPTMIFGYVGDTNISRLMAYFEKLPFAVVPGSGQALQQPIYYKDLAKAAAGAVLSEKALYQILQLGGPDIMSLKDMYRIVSDGLPVLPVPLTLLRTVARLCENVGVSFPMSSIQLKRVEIDKSVVTAPILEKKYLPTTEFKTAVDQLRREWTQTR